MSKFIEMARRHGFGFEDITEDLTGKKPEEATEPDASVKDAADLAAAAIEGAHAKPEGDTTVATGEAEEQTPEAASSDTTVAAGEAEEETDVDNTVPEANADVVDDTAVVSVEDDGKDSDEVITDDQIEDAKKKLSEAADILDGFIKNNSGDETVSNEGFSGYLKGFLVGSVMPWEGGKYKGELEAKKKELDHISEQIAKLSTEEGKKLLKEGKIKEGEFNKKFDIDPDDVRRGTIRGWFLGGYYGGAVSSKLQNVTKDYEKKVKELDALLKEAAKEEKSSNESFDDLTVSNEGFGGYVAGFIAHGLLVSGAMAVLGPLGAALGASGGGAAVSAGAAAILEKKRNELKALTKEAKKLAISKGTELVKDGKLDKEELKKHVGDIDPYNLVTPAAWGFFLGPFITAGVSSELQDIGKKIREKTKEIEETATALAEKAEKASTEEHSGDLDAAAAAPLEENNTSDEAGVIPQNADVDTVDSSTDKEHEGSNEEGKELTETDEADNVNAEAADAEMIDSKTDMEHAGKELDEAVEAVEVLEKTTASIESHYEVVKHCAARRGIDRHHVLSIGISLEHVLSDFGIDATKVVPSLESFGLEEEKKKSTAKLAERLRAILRSVMKALASAYRFVVDKVEKFAIQAKNFSPVLKKQLEMAKKALDAVEGDIVTVNVSEKVRKKLYIGKDGTVDINAITDSGALTVINDLILDGKEMAGADKEIANSIKVSLSGSPKDAIKALKAISLDAKNNFNQRLSMGANPKVPAGFNVPDGHEVASITPELPGGKVIVNMFPKKEDGELDYTKGIYGFRDARDGGDDISGSIEAVNVSKSNLKELLESVNGVVGRGYDLATARVETVRVYKAIVKALEGFTVPDSKTSDVTAEEIEELKNLYSDTLALSRANVKYATGNIDGGIKYVFSSLAPAVRELVQSALAPASKDGKKDAE